MQGSPIFWDSADEAMTFRRSLLREKVLPLNANAEQILRCLRGFVVNKIGNRVGEVGL
jgi:hypothetical protein